MPVSSSSNLSNRPAAASLASMAAAAILLAAAAPTFQSPPQGDGRWLMATITVITNNRAVFAGRRFVARLDVALDQDRRRLVSLTDHPVSPYRFPIPSSGAFIECTGNLLTLYARDEHKQVKYTRRGFQWMVPRWTDEAWTRACAEAMYSLGPWSDLLSQVLSTGHVDKTLDPPAPIVPQHRVRRVRLLLDRQSGKLTGEMTDTTGRLACTVSSEGSIRLPDGRCFPRVLCFDVTDAFYTLVVYDAPSARATGPRDPLEQEPLVPESQQPTVWRCALRYRVRYEYLESASCLVPVSAECLAMPWGDRLFQLKAVWKLTPSATG